MTRLTEDFATRKLPVKHQEILRKAVQLMMLTSGGGKFPPIAAIAKAAGVSTATIHKQYNSKRLHRDMFVQTWDDLAMAVMCATYGRQFADPSEEIAAIFTALIELLDDDLHRHEVEFAASVDRRPLLLDAVGGDTEPRSRVRSHVLSECKRAIDQTPNISMDDPSKLANTMWNHFYSVYLAHASYRDLFEDPELERAKATIKALICRTLTEGDHGPLLDPPPLSNPDGGRTDPVEQATR